MKYMAIFSIDTYHYYPATSTCISKHNIWKPWLFSRFDSFTSRELHKVLANATNGELRPAVSKEESLQIASESFNGVPKLRSLKYITSTNGHHEYREKPLPAWAVTFEHPTNTTVYVSAEGLKVFETINGEFLISFGWAIQWTIKAGTTSITGSLEYFLLSVW